MKTTGYNKSTLSRAKVLRRDLTNAEKVLWKLLRAKRFAGFKFRRQQPIGPYIADFVCQSARLVVEADGSQHADNAHDERRSAWLTARDYRVLRFWNVDILLRPRSVADTIHAALAPSPSHAQVGVVPPSPSGGEGKKDFPMPSESFDLVILGSGPGGYVAAIRASQLGLKVAIVERERLGGICLNWGCIPTKALLRTSEIYHYMQHADAYGLSAANVGFDLAKVVERSRKVAGQLNAGVKTLMKKNKVTVVEGEGRLTAATEVTVKTGDQERVLSAKNVIVATGARARDLPDLPAYGKRVWTYRHAMVPPEMPTRLLVIGSGAIGIEFASFYSDMGAKVTVVEMLDRVLPVEDADISAHMLKTLTKQGMTLITGAKVSDVKPGADGVSATITTADGKATTDTYSHVVVAIGIVPNTENIGLEALGVETDRGHIAVDGYGQTNVPGLWAIGDVTGPPWLAHKASHEGIVAVEKIAGLPHVHPFETGNIPGCTYSRPQVASVGLTEAKAKELGHAIKVGKFPFIGNGKAIALGEADGFVKTVFDAATGELLGAHMIGAEVTELIQGYMIARQLETTEVELQEAVFPHPTLSEMMHESALDAYGRALHY